MNHPIYNTKVIAHLHHPSFAAKVKNPTHIATFGHKSCGDRVEVSLTVEDGKVKYVGIVTNGCALSVAGSSGLAEMIVGKSLSYIKKFNPKKIFEVLDNPQTSPSRERCVLLAHSTLGHLEEV